MAKSIKHNAQYYDMNDITPGVYKAATMQAPGPPSGGGQLGHFSLGPSLKRAPGGPMKGPLNTCLKDRYILIEQSDLNTLIEQSQYSLEKQCNKLDKEI